MLGRHIHTLGCYRAEKSGVYLAPATALAPTARNWVNNQKRVLRISRCFRPLLNCFTTVLVVVVCLTRCSLSENARAKHIER